MNSKNKLFEIFEKVNNVNLNDEIAVKNAAINDFVSFVDQEIGLNGDLPEINISYKEGEAKENKSFGGYTPSLKKIDTVAANRNLADVLRTIGHELVHHKQNLDGKLNDSSGETGSPEENEANAMAGILLRKFGQINDNIYE